MNRPIWFLNMCAVSDWTDGECSIYSMGYWSPFILEWLDTTLVKGNRHAEAMARVIWRLWNRHVTLSKINGPHLTSVIQVYRRINGLINL